MRDSTFAVDAGFLAVQGTATKKDYSSSAGTVWVERGGGGGAVQVPVYAGPAMEDVVRIEGCFDGRGQFAAA